jgi:hypothetical protein
MRETCQQYVPDVNSDGEYRQCDTPAVDYYITTEREKFWLCAYHWDIHSEAVAMAGANPGS